MFFSSDDFKIVEPIPHIELMVDSIDFGNIPKTNDFYKLQRKVRLVLIPI